MSDGFSEMARAMRQDEELSETRAAYLAEMRRCLEDGSADTEELVTKHGTWMRAWTRVYASHASHQPDRLRSSVLSMLSSLKTRDLNAWATFLASHVGLENATERASFARFSPFGSGLFITSSGEGHRLSLGGDVQALFAALNYVGASTVRRIYSGELSPLVGPLFRGPSKTVTLDVYRVTKQP